MWRREARKRAEVDTDTLAVVTAVIGALKGSPRSGRPAAVRVMVATKPVDFCKGAEGLAALVRETIGADRLLGAVYEFRARRTDNVAAKRCRA
jgi:hypothetical protein